MITIASDPYVWGQIPGSTDDGMNQETAQNEESENYQNSHTEQRRPTQDQENQAGHMSQGNEQTTPQETHQKATIKIEEEEDTMGID